MCHVEEEVLEIKLQVAASGKYLDTLVVLRTDTLAQLFATVEARRPHFPCSARLLVAGRDLRADPITTLAAAGLSSCTIDVVWCTWSLVVSASTDTTARVWNADMGECVCEFKGHTRDVNSIMVDAPQIQAVTASDDHTAKVWDLKTGACVLTLMGHTSIVWLGTFSPDSSVVLTASRDATAKIWNASTGDCMMTFVGHRSSVRSAVFSQDGRRVATASSDHSAKLWDAAMGSELQTLPLQNEALAVVFLRQDQSLAVASIQLVVQIWDLSTYTCLFEIEGRSAAASPCGCYLATCIRTVVMLWDVNANTCVQALAGHEDDVNSASFSADGNSVVTASKDGTVRVWSATSGECSQKLAGHIGDVLWAS